MIINHFSTIFARKLIKRQILDNKSSVERCIPSIIDSHLLAYDYIYWIIMQQTLNFIVNDTVKHSLKFRLKCWDFLFGEPCFSMQYQHKFDIMISAPQKVSHEHLILGTYIDVAHNHLLYTYGIVDGEATFVPSGCRKNTH